MANTQSERRTEKLDLRISRSAKHALQAAASAKNLSLSAFVLQSALTHASEVLPDRRVFKLNDEQWEAFQAALNAPPRDLPAMRRLLTEPGFFDKKN